MENSTTMEKIATHVFSIHHHGHTTIDLLVTWEIGIDLAVQASKQLSTQGRWRRDTAHGIIGLEQHMDSYWDIYKEGSIVLRPLNTDKKTETDDN